eukprot:CAMPEP_0185267658 /NCGR_PEP_ID=MMETSP1359-20130426/34934_1 /TAXON_ID=552665 /ORGANISM="Bigelowiella longifila, Strain CCMP242" /LENGTH=158 /DNA_ID=CAMNT_0027858081 /DNA_START=137 /DNA_END=613 /DNA_ORIENTATION=+
MPPGRSRRADHALMPVNPRDTWNATSTLCLFLKSSCPITLKMPSMIPFLTTFAVRSSVEIEAPQRGLAASGAVRITHPLGAVSSEDRDFALIEGSSAPPLPPNPPLPLHGGDEAWIRTTGTKGWPVTECDEAETAIMHPVAARPVSVSVQSSVGEDIT